MRTSYSPGMAVLLISSIFGKSGSRSARFLRISRLLGERRVGEARRQGTGPSSSAAVSSCRCFQEFRAPRGQPALERGKMVHQSQAAVAKFPDRRPVGGEKSQQPVGQLPHRPGRRGAFARVAAQQPLVAERAPGLARARSRATSAATSASPRFRPWPASGCTTCAASPSSTQPGPHQALARPFISGQAARGDASVSAPASPPRGLHQFVLEAGASSGKQLLRALVRQRPDQRVRALRLRRVERQQRQHVGRSGTTAARGPGAACERDQPRGDRLLAVVERARTRRPAPRASPTPCPRTARSARPRTLGAGVDHA